MKLAPVLLLTLLENLASAVHDLLEKNSMVPAPARSEAAATNTPSLLKASGMIDALNGLEKVRCVQ